MVVSISHNCETFVMPLKRQSSSPYVSDSMGARSLAQDTAPQGETDIVPTRAPTSDRHMPNLLLALLHPAVVAAKLGGSDSVRAAVAENLLLTQQLIVLRRSQAGAEPDAE
jgi:hypothetical protein